MKVLNHTFINWNVYYIANKLEKLINDEWWLDEKSRKNKFKKWNCVKFNFKKYSKTYVYEIIFIHEWNFIKFSCIKCFTNFLGSGIFTSQKDDTTKWLI